MGYKTSPTRGRTNKAILGVERCQFLIEQFGMYFQQTTRPCIFRTVIPTPKWKQPQWVFFCLEYFWISNIPSFLKLLSHHLSPLWQIFVSDVEHYLVSGKNPGVFSPNPQQFPSHQRCILPPLQTQFLKTKSLPVVGWKVLRPHLMLNFFWNL